MFTFATEAIGIRLDCCRTEGKKLRGNQQVVLGVTNTGNGERGTGNGERGTGNGERGTGNRERESGNECTAVIRIRIQNGGRKHRNRVKCSLLIKVND